MIVFVFLLLLAFLAAVVVMWSSIDKVIRGEPPRGAVATPTSETRAALDSATGACPLTHAVPHGPIVAS